MWNLPGPGIELVPSALAGRFLSTVPPGKSESYCFNEALMEPAESSIYNLQSFMMIVTVFPKVALVPFILNLVSPPSLTYFWGQCTGHIHQGLIIQPLTFGSWCPSELAQWSVGELLHGRSWQEQSFRPRESTLHKQLPAAGCVRDSQGVCVYVCMCVDLHASFVCKPFW